ncbi:DUF2441 domain-containing protein [Carnobacterium mobile]|uniref:DUF2441 domain-containing protein n=1 Tax=Carnobacterium mobile TaxID=2750 RepID=UPI0018664C1F|nr:DUF2441 domain-containing protein [Carnobacterium mobile]
MTKYLNCENNDKRRDSLGYYHLVTRKPMYKGQKINFGSHHKNRLYYFFLENGFSDLKERTLDQAISELDSKLEENEIEFLKNAFDHSSKAIREVVTEMVRLEHFPELPSRFECLYGTEDLNSLAQWQKIFTSYNREVIQIVNLETNGKIFKGNAALLPSIENKSFLEKIEQAKIYWSSPSENILSEVLIGGEITVTKIIEDYQ